MRSFEYANPSTVKQAVGLLGSNWDDAAVLAGGTDLISSLKDTLVEPRRVVSVKGIRDLGGVSMTKDGLRIGAVATFGQLLDSRKELAEFPAILAAVEAIASPQMRSMGTVGGDLLQRPRCWYFRNGFGLLARDSQGRSLVPNGDNRYHAIFANSGPAYFVSPSSLAPALVALGARVRLQGTGSPREIAVADLFRVPQSENEREHTLAPNEILTEIVIPSAARGMLNATYEVRERQFMDWPLATASVALRMEGRRVREAHIVLGHVAPIPWRAQAAETALAGQNLDPTAAAKAGDAAVEGARPLSKNGYKVQLARVSVQRALLALPGMQSPGMG